ncbi:unnamed protein product, partial [Mycena citricolor]
HVNLASQINLRVYCAVIGVTPRLFFSSEHRNAEDVLLEDHPRPLSSPAYNSVFAAYEEEEHIDALQWSLRNFQSIRDLSRVSTARPVKHNTAISNFGYRMWIYGRLSSL